MISNDFSFYVVSHLSKLMIKITDELIWMFMGEE
jgi:hypothetical protein